MLFLYSGLDLTCYFFTLRTSPTESSIKILSFFNALYSGLLSYLLLYEMIFLKYNGLLRSFGQGEGFSDQYLLLLKWLETYSIAVFGVRQVAWTVMFWHGKYQ